MEHLEVVFSGGEFNSFNGMYSNEEAYFNAHFVNNFSNIGSTNPMNLVGIPESSMYSSDNVNVDMCSFSQGDSYENYYLSDAHHFLAMNNSSMPMKCSLNKEMSSESMEELSGNLPHTVLIDEKDFLKKMEVNEKQAEEKSAEGKISNPTENSKKRSRVSEEVQRKRNGESKNNKKCFSTNNYEEEEISLHRVSSSSFSSGDDSIASQELIGSANSNTSSKDTAILKLNGKPRASRGSATDPQSLYARKRRERINERLRTLQSLVPNGTKVDISTMLEEAVQYVKFLQLQIKLLSSDDLWMYAPIAYNGMDAGLDLNLNIPRW